PARAEGPSMRHPVEIENFEELRRQAGIDDEELRAAIRSLRVGHCVNLIFRTGLKSFTGEALRVRITSIRGCTFRGKLVKQPGFSGLSKLRVGSLIRFAAAHIQSIPARPAQ